MLVPVVGRQPADDPTRLLVQCGTPFARTGGDPAGMAAVRATVRPVPGL